MLKWLKGKMKNNKGFTILELIVVIAIMGFLIALVAPKLIDVASSSEKPVADTNIQRISQAIERHIEETGKFPDLLGNMMGDFTQTGWGVSSNGIRNSMGSIYPYSFREFGLRLHVLSEEEANDIIKLGITEFTNLADGKVQKVEGGRVVLMVGAGFMDKSGFKWLGDIKTPLLDDAEKQREFGSLFYEPELMYRIALSIGEDSELVTGGFLNNLGKHPDATKNNIEMTDYCLVLPRLQSTVNRLKHDNMFGTEGYEAFIEYATDMINNPNTPQATKDNLQKNLDGIVNNVNMFATEITVDGYKESVLPKNRIITAHLPPLQYGSENKDELEAELKTKRIIEGKKVDVSKAQDMNNFAIIGIGGEVYPNNDVYIWETTGMLVNGKEIKGSGEKNTHEYFIK